MTYRVTSLAPCDCSGSAVLTAQVSLLRGVMTSLSCLKNMDSFCWSSLLGSDLWLSHQGRQIQWLTDKQMYRRKASPTLNIKLQNIKVCVVILCLFNVCTLHLLTPGGEFPDPHQIMQYHVLLYGVKLRQNTRVAPIYRLADIFGRYWHRYIGIGKQYIGIGHIGIGICIGYSWYRLYRYRPNIG